MPERRDETSGRTVQNALFVIGGLLLASAAIVFAAVAWARFGVVGRASILGVTTVLALAVPPVALVRRLAGTAETFAALGLLLVLLDGYAAWYVDLAGVHALAPATYAGIACAVTGGVAAGYGLATRLTGPRIAALVVSQPVLPLFFVDVGLGAAGWAGVLTALAAADLAVVRRADTRANTRALPVVAWAMTGVALVATAGPMYIALVSGDTYGSAIRSGLALVLAAAVVVAASLTGPVPMVRHVAAGGAALAVVLAVTRVTAVGRPAAALALFAGEVAVLAVVVRALPGRVRPGPRVGILVAAGVLGLGAVGWTVLTAVTTINSRIPVWFGAAESTGQPDRTLPAAIVLLALAVAVLLPRTMAVEPAVVAAVLLALAVPAAVRLPWWSPSLVDGLVVAPLALAAVTARTVRRAAVYGGAAGLLATHALLVGLAQPTSATGVLAALIAVAAAVAVLGRRRQRIVGAVATGIALLALPALAAALAMTAGADPALARSIATAGLVVAAGAVVALRRWWPEYAGAGAFAVLLVGGGLAVVMTAATPRVAASWTAPCGCSAPPP